MVSRKCRRPVAWALAVTLSSSGAAAAGEPAAAPPRPLAPEVLAVFALYSARSYLEASAEAERLLEKDALQPGDRRFLAELAAAGYRDAYLAAGGKDPALLCSGVATLAAYLREPGAQPRAAELRDALAGMLVVRHPEVVCPQTNAPMGSKDIPTAVGPPVIEELPALLPVPARPPLEGTRTRSNPGVISGGVLLAVAGVLAVAVVPVQVRRVRVRGEAEALRGETLAAGETMPGQRERSEALRSSEERMRAATVGLTVSAATLTAVGVTLFLMHRKRMSKAGVEVSPQVGLAGASLVLRGRF